MELSERHFRLWCLVEMMSILQLRPSLVLTVLDPLLIGDSLLTVAFLLEVTLCYGLGYYGVLNIK